MPTTIVFSATFLVTTEPASTTDRWHLIKQSIYTQITIVCGSIT
ncbi:MAG: hypothetical protein ACR2LR_09325 [Hassallia sp.]